MSLEDFLDGRSRPSAAEAAARAERLSAALLNVVNAAGSGATPAGIGGILGAGVTSAHPSSGSASPCVILRPEFAGVPTGPPRDFGEIDAARVLDLLAGYPTPRAGWTALLEGTEVLVADLQPLAAVGDAVTGAAMRGTAGAVIATAGGGTAILTAGHAVGAHRLAWVGAQHLAVRHCEDPITGTGTLPGVGTDVAVLDLPVGTRAALPAWLAAIDGFTSARQGDWVTCHLVSGPVRDTVNRSMNWVKYSTAAGVIGACYLTDQLITAPGDSGAAATLDASPNLVTGHVVGQMTTPDDPTAARTVIQQVEWQLSAIRALLDTLP